VECELLFISKFNKMVKGVGVAGMQKKVSLNPTLRVGQTVLNCRQRPSKRKEPKSSSLQNARVRP